MLFDCTWFCKMNQFFFYLGCYKMMSLIKWNYLLSLVNCMYQHCDKILTKPLPIFHIQLQSASYHTQYKKYSALKFGYIEKKVISVICISCEFLNPNSFGFKKRRCWLTWHTESLQNLLSLFTWVNQLLFTTCISKTRQGMTFSLFVSWVAFIHLCIVTWNRCLSRK